MDLTSIISGSDNLWKYLFTLGTFMFALAILYPLQKRQELEIEINHNNKEVALLNGEIKNLKDKVFEFPKIANKSVRQIDSLRGISTIGKSAEYRKSISSSIDLIKKSFNDYDNSVKEARQQIEIKSTVLTYEKSRIDLMKGHLSEFSFYTNWLLWVGIILAAIGLAFWVRLTIKKDFSRTNHTGQP